MPRRQTLIVLNPRSGGGRQTQLLLDLAAAMPEVDVQTSAEPGDGAAMTRSALTRGYRTIIAAGGDGTVHEVVNGLAGNFGGAELGILPMGSANDLARALDLPTDIEAALARLVTETAEVRRLDVVRVTAADGAVRHMINAGTGGFSGLVNDRLDPETKQLWGGLAYIRSALEALPEAPLYELTLTVDDEPAMQVQAAAAVLANGPYAGRIECVPEAEPDDGELDLLLVTAQTFLEQAELFARFAVRQHVDSDVTVHRRGRRFHFDARPPMPFNIDGEKIGATPLTFELLPHVLRVRV